MMMIEYAWDKSPRIFNTTIKIRRKKYIFKMCLDVSKYKYIYNLFLKCFLINPKLNNSINKNNY